MSDSNINWTIGGVPVEGVSIEELKNYDPSKPTAAIMFEGEAEGAIPNGARILKVASYSGDASDTGERGTVLSSMAVPEDMTTDPVTGNPIKYVYFVEWDHTPGVPVFITDFKIAELK